MVELTQQAGAVLLGRRTYEIFASHWPLISTTTRSPRSSNRVPKYVASRTLERADWQNTDAAAG